ncbi:hypothetical protein B0J13DRAFT_595333 [Dactylonectria estremocensis]|uniref:NADPH--hemoprotein reductase n=1 Tax=Dactylonectria estremocensis TaxID=1079267 RepID=A0A9P9J9G2_9HYPO|nr:hypothetical protein B0J13DRAFT_595333 [Dactylonectria estremocensis]
MSQVIQTPVLAVLVILVISIWCFMSKSTLIQYKPAVKTGVFEGKSTDDGESPSQYPHNDAIIFFGPQTGTAETYAKRLARILSEKLGLDFTVYGLEHFSFGKFLQVPKFLSPRGNKILVIFVVATYGEGEPADNAADFYNSLKDYAESSDEGALADLQYAVFGLGNKTYERFNHQARDFDAFLAKCGAGRVSVVGAGDDSSATTDEDFEEWKDAFLGALRAFSHPQAPTVSDPALEPKVFLGERNEAQLTHYGIRFGPYNACNPLYAPIDSVRQLFAPSYGRHCLDLEFDTSGTDLRYETGDHLAVWPVNPNREVERLLRMVGVWDKQTAVVQIRSLQDFGHASEMPSPTTYENVVRYCVDICGPISRSTLGAIISFAPTEEAKESIGRLAEDKESFHHQVTQQRWNIAKLLDKASNGTPWSSLPVDILRDHLTPLRPRYYSILSSSTVSPYRIHITVAIQDEMAADLRFQGLNSQYLTAATSSSAVTHQLCLPRCRHEDIRIAVSAQQSHFRLPKDASTPMIMIGPRTGVAPSRAFVAQRVQSAQNGERVGQCVLFTGCRRPDEDFICEEEWKESKELLEHWFHLHVAFSRVGPSKVYVQHLLKEQATKVLSLLENENAHLYICGDVKMAKDVAAVLVNMIAQHRSCPEDEVWQLFSPLKAKHRFQHDGSHVGDS